MALTQRDATVRTGRLARSMKRRRRRIPRQQPPTPIQRDYYARLIKILEVVRRALAPLRAELPHLARPRADGIRIDAGEGARVRELIRQARQTLEQDYTIGELAIEEIAREFARRTSTWQRQQLGRQVQAALGADVFHSERGVLEQVDAFVHENASLVTSLAPRALDDIEQVVTRGIANGALSGVIADEIEARLGVAEDRAKTIAVDQVGKLYGQLNATRQQNLGVEHFFWRTARDARVRGTPKSQGGRYPRARPSHHAREGVRYAYSDPPKSLAGTPELPGEPVRCRCYAEPDFGDIVGEIDEQG